jgi:hypothetical protein
MWYNQKELTNPEAALQGRHTCRPNPIHCDSKKERTGAVVLINSHEGGSSEPASEARGYMLYNQTVWMPIDSPFRFSQFVFGSSNFISRSSNFVCGLSEFVFRLSQSVFRSSNFVFGLPRSVFRLPRSVLGLSEFVSRSSNFVSRPSKIVGTPSHRL